jgi:hypothetical protein
MTDEPPPQGVHYQEPGWFTRNIFNGVVALFTRLGLSVWGSRVLRVRGRTTGEWRSNPVNLLTCDGQRYLVAPRGHTQWVRNLRVAGSGELSCAPTCAGGRLRWASSSVGSARTHPSKTSSGSQRTIPSFASGACHEKAARAACAASLTSRRS